MDPNLRNLKDFLGLYNKVTELCFSRCVDDLTYRELTDSENSCVDKCVTKFARFNQNMMKVYVEVQSTINIKRMQEMEESAKKAEQQQPQELIKTIEQDNSATVIFTPKPNLAL